MQPEGLTIDVTLTRGVQAASAPLPPSEGAIHVGKGGGEVSEERGLIRRAQCPYKAISGDVSEIIDAARDSAAPSVDAAITAANWLTGRRRVEFEQSEEERAEYGTALVQRLSVDLTARFPRGFYLQKVQYMHLFYLSYPPGTIWRIDSVPSTADSPDGVWQVRDRFRRQQYSLHGGRQPRGQPARTQAPPHFPAVYSQHLRGLHPARVSHEVSQQHRQPQLLHALQAGRPRSIEQFLRSSHGFHHRVHVPRLKMSYLPSARDSRRLQVPIGTSHSCPCNTLSENALFQKEHLIAGPGTRQWNRPFRKSVHWLRSVGAHSGYSQLAHDPDYCFPTKLVSLAPPLHHSRPHPLHAL